MPTSRLEGSLRTAREQPLPARIKRPNGPDAPARHSRCASRRRAAADIAPTSAAAGEIVTPSATLHARRLERPDLDNHPTHVPHPPPSDSEPSPKPLSPRGASTRSRRPEAPTYSSTYEPPGPSLSTGVRSRPIGLPSPGGRGRLLLSADTHSQPTADPALLPTATPFHSFAALQRFQTKPKLSRLSAEPRRRTAALHAARTQTSQNAESDLWFNVCSE